jgi:DHA1 family tetracycline resistance protein-like MFS transporter
LFIPLFPQIAANVGASQFQLSFLLSAYPLAQFFASPILGSLSDRFGRRPILFISKLGSVVAYLILAFARSFPLLLLSRLIDGSTGGNIPVARAYIADITTKENRSRGMAVIGIAFGLGFIIGPAIGGLLYQVSHTTTVPLLFGASLSLFSSLLTWFFLPETVTKPVISSPLVINPLRSLSYFSLKTVLGRLIWANFLITILYSGFQTTTTFFSTAVFGFSPGQNGQLLIYIGVLGFVIQGLFAKVTIRRPVLLTIVGIIVSGLGIIFVSQAGNLPLFYLALAFSSFGSSLVGIFLATVFSSANDKVGEGESMGALDGTGSLGRIFGPGLAAIFITGHPRPLYLVLGLLMLPIALFFSQSRKSPTL